MTVTKEITLAQQTQYYFLLKMQFQLNMSVDSKNSVTRLEKVIDKSCRNSPYLMGAAFLIIGNTVTENINLY